MKIDIITGSRAEYGIMRNLIKELLKESELEINVVVTGMHLEEKFGYTINDIIADNIPITKEIPSGMIDSSDIGIITSIEKTMSGFKYYFTENRPDVILILGDRFEIYAVATVAALFRIPIIHLHGGEKTSGNYDEFIRHAITKMAHLHLVSTDEFRSRVIQLGEHPNSVFNVGALGVENILQSELYSLEEINKQIQFSLSREKYFVVAFHPETLRETKEYNEPLLAALEELIKKDKKIILIGTNSDTNSDIFTKNLRSFEKQYPEKVKLLVSVPSTMYYSLISHSKMFIGNSSSGLIEVPSLNKVSINIGDRQKGRVIGNSIINCSLNKKAILQAVEQGEKFNEVIINPYAKENTCVNMIEIIKENKNLLKNAVKDFYDLERK